MDKQKCLVTGGVGFVGSHLVKKLNAASVAVVVADRRPIHESPILEDCDNVRSTTLDLRNPNEVAHLIRDTKPNIVYHLAAQPLSGRSNDEPFVTMQDNVVATYAVLDAIRKHSPDTRLVFASSACFYGVPRSQPPLQEFDAPSVGHYVYTATKIAADFAVQHYRHIYGLDCSCIRFVNIYGPGEMHFERIVPKLILKALNGESPTLTQSDGQDVLSFLYIDDAVTVLRLIGERPTRTTEAVWNVEGSPPISITELMNRIYRQCGTPSNGFASIGTRRGRPVHKYLDGTRLRTTFGWTPAINLDAGLDSTIRWYREHFSTFSPLNEKGFAHV